MFLVHLYCICILAKYILTEIYIRLIEELYVALFDTYVGANYETDGEISKYETRVTTSLPCGIPFEVTVKEDNNCPKMKFHRHINHGKISLFHLLHMINLPIGIFI